MDHHGIRYLGKTGEASLESADYIFAVSDGMGGAKSGEFASRIAVEKITLLLPKQFGLVEDRFHAYSNEILLELFTSIHSTMLQLGRIDENCRDMGATLTLAWFRRGRVYFGHIGDSRLYVLPENGIMQQVSEDHTYVGWLRRTGQINERQQRMHPRKNVLTQALGAGHRYLNPQLGVMDYQPGDQFVLCTDGVTEGLWDRGIEEIVRQSALQGSKTVPSVTATSTEANLNSSTLPSPSLPADPHEVAKSAAARLVQTAVCESGRDNATAVVVQALP